MGRRGGGSSSKLKIDADVILDFAGTNEAGRLHHPDAIRDIHLGLVVNGCVCAQADRQ